MAFWEATLESELAAKVLSVSKAELAIALTSDAARVMEVPVLELTDWTAVSALDLASAISLAFFREPSELCSTERKSLRILPQVLSSPPTVGSRLMGGLQRLEVVG